ncbi:MAG: WecB/TagA/CpsF family glycosyltransferase [Elusimicrobiota bacterium]|jgi:N-acetylglucosaminyldiphosphoundecaprenol N-acetyl-beta-D-mannosaminyltransferase
MPIAPNTVPSLDISPIGLKSETVLPPVTFPSVSIFGVRFDSLTMDETLLILDEFVQRRRPTQVCLANAYTVALCRKDEALRNLLEQSDLVLADGMSIVWGAHWIGLSLPERIAGPDLMTGLCKHASQKGYSIFLMGSSRENLDMLQKVLLSRWPRLRIVGLYNPSMCDQFDEDENRRILEMIRQARPDILFVGMSAPKQEKWIAQNLNRLHAPVCMGVGAAFDFLSGRIPRAPERLQRIGLEWLYRLSCEPRRLWRRYILGNIVFLSLLLNEIIRYKFSRLRAFRF